MIPDPLMDFNFVTSGSEMEFHNSERRICGFAKGSDDNSKCE